MDGSDAPHYDPRALAFGGCGLSVRRHGELSQVAQHVWKDFVSFVAVEAVNESWSEAWRDATALG